MKPVRTMSITLFVLGLGLAILGTVLLDYSQTSLPFLFDGERTTYPYQGTGLYVVIIGLAVMAVAYGSIMLKRRV